MLASVKMRVLCFAVLALVASYPARPALAQPVQPRSLMQLLQQQYGLPVPPVCAETDTSVLTSPVRVFNNDPAAFFTLIYNNGTANCFRANNPNVSTTTGQLIPANGGFIEFDFLTDGVIPAQEFWIVCSSGTNSLHLQRCVLQ